MRRPDETPSDQPAGKWPDGDWAKKLPLLSEHLGDTTWEDGAPRELSTLTVKCEDGRIVVALNDREGHRSLYRSGETVNDALKALEKAVGDPGADWRAWHQGQKGGKRK